MFFTITGPITLQKLIEDSDYVLDLFSDGSKAVAIRNVAFTYDLPTKVVTPIAQGPLFIEGAALRKKDGSTDMTSDGDQGYLRGTETYIETGPAAGWDEDITRYITEGEAYPLFSGEVHNFSTFNYRNIHLSVCPGDSVIIKVFSE